MVRGGRPSHGLVFWAVGEADIEWYYRMEEGFPSRKPLIEA